MREESEKRSEQIDTAVDRYVRKSLQIGGGILAAVGISYWMIPAQSFLALLAGFLLSYLFVFSNFFVVKRIDSSSQSRFLKTFFTALALRFILVLSLFTVAIQTLKIDQIIFTVSFIISYILLSVIEVIFINKILEKAN